MFFPSLLRYAQLREKGVFYKADETTFLLPYKRAQLTVRVLASSLTPDYVGGAEVAGLT